MSTGSREETLFSEALALPVAERAAFLADDCAHDPALRARVEALLAAAAESRCVLDTSAAPRPAVVIEEKPGDVIGRYKLLQQIGEGGCGVVYMAEQQEPVFRRVALKVIKLGMDTKAVVARFEAERQALALMDHPNIAKVLDGGATDTGRPYFVMELVRGIPITRFCDDRNLSAAERLSLFVQVCQAIQHAHQKGIIHRDIKPSNVLVTLHDDKAVPVVIDFGIAKATTGRLTDRTLFTSFDQFMGTPVYMAPEQADYNALDVDTRSDIYSLGVLLYELLTGRPPFDPKTLTNVAVAQMRHVICEVEPPPPSVRLRTLDAEERTTIARLRGTVPQRLSLILRGDLDWIVMKAMEKNRTRRYESAAALAADITRHLNHEPVIARPPSTAYRLLKFTRRHRFGVAAAAALMTVLVGGIIASTWQAVLARRAEDRAVAEREKAVAATKEAAAARDEVQRSRGHSEKLLFYMLGDLRPKLAEAGRLDLAESLADRAMEYVKTLNERDQTDAVRLGKVKALSLIGTVRVDQKRFPEALAILTEANVLAALLSARQPANADVIYERAQIEFWISDVYRRSANPAATEEWLGRYRDSALELMKLEPEKLRSQQEVTYAHHNVAVLDVDRGNLDAAHVGFMAKLAMLEKMIAANPKDSSLQLSLATTHSFLGTIAERRGNYAEALDRYRAQSSLLEANLARSPLDIERRYKLSVSRTRQTEFLLITGRVREAGELLARVLADFDAIVARDPANSRWRLNSFAAQVLQAELDLAAGRLELAAERLRQARPAVEAFSTTVPSDRNALGMTVTVWRLEAALRLALRRADAGEAARKATELAAKCSGGQGVPDSILGQCALAQVVAGAVAESLAQREAAQEHGRRALELIGARRDTSNDWRLLDPAARALILVGRGEEGHALIRRLHALGYRPLAPWPAGPAS